MKVFFLLILAIFTLEAKAYVNFIGHGYTSCLNCHFNPTGGGPLNDYGRVISATAISSRVLFPKKLTEERLAYASGFLFRKPKQEWFRTQLNYRGFQLVRNPGSTNTESKQWINMQADARVILKFGENDRFISVLNYGYSPLPDSVPEGTNDSNWRSREHYVGFKFTPKFGVYAGLMDKAFGLKVIEHIAYSRQLPNVTQNDQTHGVLTHFLGESWEGFGQVFLGNMSQDDDVRMKGASLMFEKTMFESHRYGGSVMKQSNNYLDLLSYSAHTRLNLKDGSALLAEVGQVTRTTENGTDDRTSRYALIQTYLRPFRGLYFLTNIEYLNRDTKLDPYTVRWGPGVQFFPMQRIELRFDMFNTRNFSPDASTKDSWMYLFQTHIWL